MAKTLGMADNGRATTISTIFVAVGTKNPCKINAVRRAFEDAIVSTESKLLSAQLIIHAYSVPSGVSDQPLGDEETKLGAKNRAAGAYQCCLEEHGECHFAVGLEGGIEVFGDAMWCTAWMAILGGTNELCTTCMKSPLSNGSHTNMLEHSSIWGFGKTGSFPLPSQIVDLIQNRGMELGDADDQVFSRVNSKQGSGTVGILTNNMIDRSDYYVHALKLALIPWIWPDLYIFHQMRG